MSEVAVWLLHDLPLHDYLALQTAWQSGSDSIAFIYIWRSSHFGLGKYSYPPPCPASSRLHPLRERFIVESFIDLSQWAAPAPFHILEGEAQEVIPHWAVKQGIEAIYAHAETPRGRGIPLYLLKGNSLYDEAQLSFPIENLPFLFTRFRQPVERYTDVKSPLPVPASLPRWSEPLSPPLNSLKEHLESLPIPPEGKFVWRGGGRCRPGPTGGVSCRTYFHLQADPK